MSTRLHGYTVTRCVCGGGGVCVCVGGVQARWGRADNADGALAVCTSAYAKGGHALAQAQDVPAPNDHARSHTLVNIGGGCAHGLTRGGGGERAWGLQCAGRVVVVCWWLDKRAVQLYFGRNMLVRADVCRRWAGRACAHVGRHRPRPLQGRGMAYSCGVLQPLPTAPSGYRSRGSPSTSLRTLAHTTWALTSAVWPGGGGSKSKEPQKETGTSGTSGTRS